MQDTNNVDSLIAKIDHQFNDSESLTGRYAFAHSQQVFPAGRAGVSVQARGLPQFAQTSPTRVQLVSASLLSTLSPSKINEVRFGYSRYRTSFSSLNAELRSSHPRSELRSLAQASWDFRRLTSAVFDNLGASGFSVPRGRTSQSFQILDNFTWLSGRHTLKFGGEYRRAPIDSFNDNLERGIFSFTSEASSRTLAACRVATPTSRLRGHRHRLTLVGVYDRRLLFPSHRCRQHPPHYL